MVRCPRPMWCWAALCLLIPYARTEHGLGHSQGAPNFKPIFNGAESIGTFADVRSHGTLPYTCHLRWAYFMDRGAAYSQPTLAVQRGGETALLVSSLGANLHALHPENGTVKWKFYDAPFSAAPTVMPNGNIVIGGQNHELHVVAFNGSALWMRKFNDSVMAKPLVNHLNEIYIGSEDGTMHKFSANGTYLWNYTTGAAIYGGASILRDGSIVFGNNVGKVFCLTKDGEERWVSQVADQEPGAAQLAISTTPAIGDTTILVGCKDHKLYALNMDGSPKWNYTTGAPVANAPTRISQTEFVATGQDTSLYRFLGDGSLGWEHLLGSWPTPPIVAGKTIIAGTWNKLLIGFTFWGEMKWQIELLGSIRGKPFVMADGTIIVGCTDGYVYALHIEGEEMAVPKYTLYTESYYKDLAYTLTQQW